MITDAQYETIQQLATFASETTFSDIPADVIDRAHTVLQDTIGVIIGGLTVPEVARLAQHASDNHSGQSQIIGTDYFVRPEWAGLVYGTAGTTLEFDEGHAFARGHAAIHAVSTMLALASASDISGEDAITALIIGYEVAARIGVASKLRPAVHPFGAWGVIGVASMAGKLAGLNAEDMLALFDLSASYAITPSYKSALQGANVRNTYAGMVNHNGLLAFEMFKLGFHGEQGGVITAFGEILGDTFDTSAIIDGLGERYEMMRGYIKPYSACRYSHAAVDAVLAVHEQLTADDISAITVETYDFASTLSDPNPVTPLGARFSIPYIVATTIYDGDAGADSFTDEAIQREMVCNLAKKVTVQESESYTAMLPEKRAAKITFHMGNASLVSEAIGSKGDSDKAMSKQELLEKFLNLTEHLPEEHRQRLWKLSSNLAQLKQAKALFGFSREKILLLQ